MTRPRKDFVCAICAAVRNLALNSNGEIRGGSFNNGCWCCEAYICRSCRFNPLNEMPEPPEGWGNGHTHRWPRNAPCPQCRVEILSNAL